MLDGLKKGRKVYVRQPGGNENNANNELIKRGAVPVDIHGFDIAGELKSIVQEKETKYRQGDLFDRE